MFRLIVIILLTFVGSGTLLAQTSTDPTQTVCVGTVAEPYLVSPTAGSTYHWMLTGGGTLNNTTTNSTTIDWGFIPGTYTVLVTETNINGCAGVPVTVAVTVIEIEAPTFTQVEAICVGDVLSALPTTSNDGVTGTWSPAMNNTVTTTYTFTPDAGQCATTSTMTIAVNSVQSPDFTIVYSEINQTIIVTVTDGSGEYEYQLNDGFWQNNNVFINITGCGDQVIKVRDVHGCADEVIETVEIINYPRFFTPNGDSFNDYWNIGCLTDLQEEYRILIFDRYGKLLTKIKPNELGWDGTYHGNKLPSTDYWFIVNNLMDQSVYFRGHFSLKR